MASGDRSQGLATLGRPGENVARSETCLVMFLFWRTTYDKRYTRDQRIEQGCLGRADYQHVTGIADGRHRPDDAHKPGTDAANIYRTWIFGACGAGNRCRGSDLCHPVCHTPNRGPGRNSVDWISGWGDGQPCTCRAADVSIAGSGGGVGVAGTVFARCPGAIIDSVAKGCCRQLSIMVLFFMLVMQSWM